MANNPLPPAVPHIDPATEHKRVATAMIDQGWPNLDTSALRASLGLQSLPTEIQRLLDRFRETGLKPFQEASTADTGGRQPATSQVGSAARQRNERMRSSAQDQTSSASAGPSNANSVSGSSSSGKVVVNGTQEDKKS